MQGNERRFDVRRRTFLTEDNIEVRIKCYIQDRIIIKNLHVQLNNAKILAAPAGRL